MPKGGARTRSGPPPDPNALSRERDAGEWVILPPSGRPGKPPPWPLTRASARELALWARHWAKPQALMWERLGLEHEVAMYVRNLAEAEKAGAAVALRTLLRQMSDSLGLTTPGIRANRWKIEAARPATAPVEATPARKGARDRLRVVVDGTA